MASPFFLGGQPTVGTNWSTGSVVSGSNTHTATLDARMTSPLIGENQLTVTLSRLDIFAQSFNVGSTSAPWQIGASLYNINLPPADGSSNAGPAMVAVNFGTNVANGTVYGGRSSGVLGQEAVQLAMDNAANVLNVLGGRVGVARMTPAQTSVVGTVAASGSAVVALGRGATVSLADIDGGALVRSEGTLAAANVRSGVLVVDSAAAVTTLTLFAGSRAQVLSRIGGNEIGTLHSNGGTLDLTPDVRPLQVGTINLNAGVLTVRVRTDASQLQYTAINFNGGGIVFEKAT